MGELLRLLIFCFAIPFVMVIFGAVLRFQAASDITSFFGYRTRASARTKETWEYANKLAGMIWMATGIVLAAVSIPVYLYVIDHEVSAIVLSIYMMVQIVVLIATFAPVDKAVNRKFDENGRRKV